MNRMALNIWRSTKVVVPFIICWSALYEVAGVFDIAPFTSAWYPAAGVTVAFVLVFGVRYWPLAFLGPGLYHADPTLLDVLGSARHTLVYGSAAVILRYIAYIDIPLRRTRDVHWFIGVSIAATLLSAFLAMVTFVITDTMEQSKLTVVFVSFWVGDLSGVLMGAPIFLMAFALFARETALPLPEPWKVPRTGAMAIGMIGVVSATAAVFLLDRTLSLQGSLWFVILFPVGMLALTYGFGAAIVAAVVINIAIVVLYQALGRHGNPAQVQVLVLMVDVAVLLIGATVSDLKTKAEELRVAALRNHTLAAAVEATPLGVVITGGDPSELTIQYANAAFATLMDGGHVPPVGRRLREILAGELAGNGHRMSPASPVPGGEHVSYELVIIDSGTGKRVVTLDLAPVLQDGRCVAHVGILADVTDRRRREEIERINDRLVSLGQLAGGLAHEINNLLHPIINAAKAAEEEFANRDEDFAELMQCIRRSGEQAGDIVWKVLTFARNSGDVIGTPISFDVAVKSALDFNRHALAPNVEIQTTIRGDGKLALVGATEVTQVVTNLVINAAHAVGGHGQVGVTVDLVEHTAGTDPSLPLPEGPYLRLCVSDTGIGMDEATRSRVFEPFFTTKEQGKGTGLGLSVVHGIVQGWKGHISVTSAPDQGTTFTVHVPVYHPAQPH